MLNRTVRGLTNLVDPLISDETSRRTKGNEIPRADAHRSINLSCCRMLPFGTNNVVKIRSHLKKCGPRLTISVNKRKWASSEAISRPSFTWCVANRKGHCSPGRWLIRRIHNTRTTSVVKKMIRGNHRGNLMDERGEVASGNERGGEAACGDVWGLYQQYGRISWDRWARAINE